MRFLEFPIGGGPPVEFRPEIITPAVPKSVSAYDVLQLFTTKERVAIRTAAKTDPIVEDFLHLFDIAAAEKVPVVLNEKHPLGLALQYMIDKNIAGITLARKNEILGA